MELHLDPNEVMVFLAAFGYLAMAVVVLRTRADRVQNRWFVAVLGYEFVLAAFGAAMSATTSLPLAYACNVIFTIALASMAPLYFGFLSTLPTRISRALRRPVWRILPWIVPAITIAMLVVNPDLVVAQPDPTARDPWATTQGPLAAFLHPIGLLTMFLGLIVAILYWRSTEPGTLARRQASIFAFAFAIHDGGMVAILIAPIVTRNTGTELTGPLFIAAYYGLPLVKLALLVLLSYGILRTQLFDIDLKVKWTLSRGTALAAIALVFGAVKETLEYLLPGEGLAANLAGAVAIAIVARPALVLGRALAERALPEVRPTEDFLLARKLEVFRSSLESALTDGDITPRERRILETLRVQLGIDPSQAAAMEGDLRPPAGSDRVGTDLTGAGAQGKPAS